MARFFILSINYSPEPTGFAPHATALAEHLGRRGHDVSVFTGFPFAPEWRRRPDDRGRWFATERTAPGVTVHRLTHYIPRRPSSLAERAAMEGSFSAAAFAAVLPRLIRRSTRPDVILYMGAQPAIAMLARVAAGLAGCAYFVNLNDLAARAAADVGIVGSRMSRLLERFEFAAYRRAAGVSVLCRAFEEILVSKGYPRDRIRLIRSPVDLERVHPSPAGAFRGRHGIPASAFVVMHAGSMGRKQALLDIVAAADRTRDAGISWVLVGDGEMRPALVEAARARNLSAPAIVFVPFQDEDQMAEMFGSADVLLLSQVRDVKDTVIPSKLLTYMAAGRPVLAAVNGGSQGAEILLEAEGGTLIPPEDPAALAAAALALKALPAEVRGTMAARNRAYAERHFDQRRIVSAHESFMLARS